MGRVRAILAALALLAATRAAPAGPIIKPGKAKPAIEDAMQDLLRGPEVLPNGAGVVVEGRTGILRTLELDDTTTLRVRLSIPF